MKALFISLAFFQISLLSAQQFATSESSTYALVVGISEYQHIDNLKYADKDAIAFAEYLASDKGYNLPKENIMLLTNERATSSSIYNGFGFLNDEVQQGDKVIFYFSGHGDITGISDYQDLNTHYLLTHESEKDRYETTAIQTQNIIKSLYTLTLKGVEAQLILDASNAGLILRPGSFINMLEMGDRYDPDKMTIFTSCRMDEYSWEFDDLRHSVFNYFLIQGLLGAADRDHDLSISLAEIERYVEENVYRYVNAKGNIRQTPGFKGPYSKIISYLTDTYYHIDSLSTTIDTTFRGIDTSFIKQNNNTTTEVPKFNFSAGMNCNGQAILTDKNFYEIEFILENEAEYFLINEKKFTNFSKGKNVYKAPLQYGINEIKISAHNKLETHVEQVTIYSSFKPILPLTASQKMNHYGLFIASDDYQNVAWSNLNNPIYDARTMALELEANFGFEIDTLFNPGKRDIKRKLRSYAKRFKNTDYEKRNDHLLIFIAGHGTYDDISGQGYYVTCDSEVNDDFDSCLNYGYLRELIDNLNFKHILVVLDVCKGGTFDAGLASSSKRGGGIDIYSSMNTESFIKEKTQFKTRKLHSSGKDVPVYDGAINQHSPFMRRYLEALRNPKERVLTLQDIEVSLDKSKPAPHYSAFGSNAPGSNFLFLYRNPINDRN